MVNTRKRMDDPRTIPTDPMIDPIDPVVDPRQPQNVRESRDGSGAVFLAVLVLLVLGGFWFYYGDTRPMTNVAQNEQPAVTQPAQPEQPVGGNTTDQP